MKATKLMLLCAFALTVFSATADEIKIGLNEMSFEIEGAKKGAPLVLRAGREYEITFENVGQVLHEVLIGRGHTGEGGEMNYAEHLLEAVEVDVFGDSSKGFFEIEANGIKEIELDPGMKLTIEVTIPESARGTWELGCFAPGHHQSGMHLPIIIE